MYYHPIIGIIIFIIAVVISFYIGRFLLKKSNKNKISSFNGENDQIKNNSIPKGEITSPDAPWLKEK
jgi:septation ring formation regulator EzrA